jgi:hypothetical protein
MFRIQKAENFLSGLDSSSGFKTSKPAVQSGLCDPVKKKERSPQ